MAAPPALDLIAVSRQLLRALRGERSQVAFSRRLRHRSNVAANWEAGRRFPRSHAFFHACERSGTDVPAALAAFHPRAAQAWSAEAVHPWLQALCGEVTQAELARRTTLSAQQVGRFLRGDAEPRLPELLELVQGATGRVEDLALCLVGDARMPALERVLAGKEALQQLLHREPQVAATLVASGVEPPGPDQVARLAARLGRPEDEVHRHLELIADARGRGLTLALPRDGEALQRTRRHWAQVARDRLDEPREGDRFAFNLFTVRREDADEIIALQTRYFRALQSLAAASSPAEEAVLVVMHTVRF